MLVFGVVLLVERSNMQCHFLGGSFNRGCNPQCNVEDQHLHLFKSSSMCVLTLSGVSAQVHEGLRWCPDVWAGKGYDDVT